MALSTDLNRSLSAWLDYIEAVHPQEIEFGLTRVAAVFNRLFPEGLPYPVITVAGTNGKGSCCAYLEAILMAQTKVVGKYTSPHLQQFNERIMLNAQMVDDAAIVNAFSLIEGARAEIELTYFEFATLAALIIFAEQSVDVAVLEVGLGGRLDAVNILDPLVSVVTSVGLDHVDWLGSDRGQIALEKAAIARSGRPCVVGEPDFPDEASDFLHALGAKLCRLGHELNISSVLPIKDQDTWAVLAQVEGLPLIDMAGLSGVNNSVVNKPAAHQYRNAACAITAAAYFNHLAWQSSLSVAVLNQALNKTAPIGRCQVLSQEPLIVLDVAHNEDSVVALRDFLAHFSVSGKTYAVFSMLRDKDIAQSLEVMIELIDDWHIAELTVPRAASVLYLSCLLYTSPSPRDRG